MAGDIILSNGTTITASEVAEIASEVKKLIAKEAKEPSQYEEVDSLANLTTLPALLQNGSVYKLVRVAVELLKGMDGKEVSLRKTDTALQWQREGDDTWQDLITVDEIQEPAKAATDAANAAATAANTAATNADTATGEANTATTNANAATESANNAATSANAAATAANNAADRVDDSITDISAEKTSAINAANSANQAATSANSAATEATEAATSANNAASAASNAATEANTATTKANTAASSATSAANAANNAASYANEMADHTPIIGEDGLWYRWNTETKEYEDTGMLSKGDAGQSFKVIAQYDTEEDLRTAVPDGSNTDGFYAVGNAAPYHYYSWTYKNGEWGWVDQGVLMPGDEIYLTESEFDALEVKDQDKTYFVFEG